MTYKLKVLQQGLEQEEASHKATKARLADKSKIESIEGAKSEAMKGKALPELSGMTKDRNPSSVKKLDCGQQGQIQFNK